MANGNVEVEIKDKTGKVLGTVEAPEDATDEQIVALWKQKQKSDESLRSLKTKQSREGFRGFLEGFSEQTPNPVDMLKASVPTDAPEFAGSFIAGPLGMQAVRVGKGIQQQAGLGAKDISEKPGLRGQVKSFGRTFAAMVGLPNMGQVFDDLDSGNIPAASGAALSLGLQALLARGGVALQEGISRGVRRNFGKVSEAEAANLVARELSQPMTSAQLQGQLQAAHKAIKQAAGVAKGKVIAEVLEQNPNTFVEYQSTLPWLNEQIAKLQKQKADRPRLFEKSEPGKPNLGDTLQVLTELKNTIQRETQSRDLQRSGILQGLPQANRNVSNLVAADETHSSLFQLREQMEPKTASAIIAQLNERLTGDILSSIPAVSKQDYLVRSGRYRQIMEESNKKLWESVLSKETNADQAVKKLAAAPVEAAEGIRNIFENNQTLAKKMRRLVFEEWVQSGTINKVIPEPTIKALYGQQASKIEAFQKALREPNGILDLGDGYITARIPGLPGVRVGEPVGSRTIVQVRIKDLAKAIDDPKVLDALIDAGRTKITSANANVAAYALVSALNSAQVKTRQIESGIISLAGANK